MRWMVSVKGVVLDGDRVLLAYNDRSEWELPGGRLEMGESPEECVAREIREETGLEVRVGPILSSWVFEVIPDRFVLIIAYGCVLRSPVGAMRVSAEHSAVEFVAVDRLGRIPLPDGYR